MSQHWNIEQLLCSEDGDAGCPPGEDVLDAFVELELAGKDPAAEFPGTAIHLRSCQGCRLDHDGLLEAAVRFGEVAPA
jgi:hypothetical protein